MKVCTKAALKPPVLAEQTQLGRTDPFWQNEARKLNDYKGGRICERPSPGRTPPKTVAVETGQTARGRGDLKLSLRGWPRAPGCRLGPTRRSVRGTIDTRPRRPRSGG